MSNNQKRPSVEDRRNHDNDILTILLAFLLGTLMVFLAVV